MKLDIDTFIGYFSAVSIPALLIALHLGVL